MSDTSTVRKAPPQAQSSGSGHTLMPKRQAVMNEHFASKHVCFYKSGDAQFSGLPVVINKRTFKTFEGLLDSLSKRVPLPFGVRTITTPRGQTVVRSLDQLHHGHSYICSDKRTVKPINLDQARRKPPPWYHARPVSSRRLASTRQSFGPRSAPWNEYAAMLHTPKRVVIFRNGAPDVKHTLLLHKRNTRSFKELMDFLSEVMNFPVHKLHTVDGRRVDGLLALILCSGVLVASGREPFRKNNYNIQKFSAPLWLPAKGVERLYHKTKKRKSSTNSTRPFSPSSERYIVNQLNNNFSENAHHFTGSGEKKTGKHVDSVEADTMTCKDVTAQESIYMPSNDDIEKSFRVNEDGSMTVEMKVRLTIKNEETVHWTTTLSRSTVPNEIKFVSESHTVLSELVCDNSSEVDTKTLKISPEKHIEDFSKGGLPPLEESSTGQSIVVKEPLQPCPSSLECCQSKQKQLSFGSSNNKSKTRGQHNLLGLYTEKEETSNEQIKQVYPVPKPRNTMSCKLNTTSSEQQSNIYESAEVMQLQNNGKEAALHIVQQQTSQNGFLAEEFNNHGITTCASSGDQSVSFNNVFPACTEIPSSVKDNISNTDGPLHMGKCKKTTSNIQTAEKALVMKSAKQSTTRITSPAGKNRNKKPVRVIVKKSYRTHIATNKHMRKIDILKEIKKIRADIFSQAGVMRTMIKYYQAKAVYKVLKSSTNRDTDHGNFSPTVHNDVQLNIQHTSKSATEYCNSRENLDQTFLYSRKQHNNLTALKTNVLYISAKKSTLKRQTSMQNEQDFQREMSELRESASLPALHFSSSTNEHVAQKEEPPPKLQLSVQASEISSENTAAQKESCEDLTVDSCSTIVSLTKSLKEDTFISKKEKLPINHSAKNLLVTIESTKDNLSSSLSKNDNAKNDILLSDKETKSPILNLPLNNSSKKEISLQPFQYNDCSSKNYTTGSLNTLDTVNGHLKQAPELKTPSLNMPLPNQHFIERLPSNITMAMASLFTNQGVERSPSSDITIRQSSLIRRSESAKTFLEKSKVKSDSINSSSQRDLGTGPPSANGKETYMVKMAVQSDMIPILDKLCYAIRSLGEVTSLVKSNNKPDIFSYVASIFGSSLQVLVAFLSVMSLKDSLENQTVQQQADNSSSCPEALLLLLSLKEMASIKNGEDLRSSLNVLQNSMSDQLLHSWRNFKELCNQSLKCSVTCMCNRSKSNCEPGSTEEGIQWLIEELGVPDRVREELAAISPHEECIIGNTVVESDKLCKSFSEVKLNKCAIPVLNEEMIRWHDSEDDVSKYNSSVIEKAINADSKECESLHDSTAPVVSDEDQIKVGCSEQVASTCSVSINSEDRLVTSLEEEDDNCDEEYMDFSEDLINNKVDSIQMSQPIVSGTEQQHSSQNSTQGLASQEQSQQYSNRDNLKGAPELKPIESNMKTDKTLEQERQQIQTSHFNEVQQKITKEPYMYEEHLGNQRKHGFKDTMVCEKNTPQTKKYSVAELINNVESFTQETSNRPESQVNRFIIQTDLSEPLYTDKQNSIYSETSETIPSSLAFSYESLSSSLAQEQERTTHVNRVKSIRDMFLAKSSTKTQHRLHSADLDHSESIESGEIRSQRSPETSSGEDDTCRSAIGKGFVRRTIEKIYGRGNMNSTRPNDISPQSAKGKRRKSPGRTNVTNLASFHEARARLMSDLAYFSATSSCEVLNTPAHGEVERDTKSPVKYNCEIGKKSTTIISEPLQKKATDDTHNRILPFDDSLATTISYFNLPNASDSELEPEEQKSHNSQTEVKVTPEHQIPKSWAEKNSFLPVFTPPVFKKADNKVYPLKEPLKAVVTQPVSRPSAQTGVVRHSAEPDLLEMLFIFCGQHCPVL